MHGTLRDALTSRTAEIWRHSMPLPREGKHNEGGGAYSCNYFVHFTTDNIILSNIMQYLETLDMFFLVQSLINNHKNLRPNFLVTYILHYEDNLSQNKLAKPRKMRKPPGTLGLKKFGPGKIWVNKNSTQNTCILAFLHTFVLISGNPT